MTKRRQRAGLAAVLALLLIGIGVSLEANRLSCERSNTVRRSQMGYEQYAIDATDARATAARLRPTSLPGTADYALAQNDAWAAARFRADVARTRISLLKCSGIFPDNP